MSPVVVKLQAELDFTTKHTFYHPFQTIAAFLLKLVV